MIVLPPYARLLGVEIDEGAPGTAPLIRMPWIDRLMGRPGYLHGGVMAGVLEIAAFTALRHAIEDPAVGIRPINVSCDFLRNGRMVTTYAQGRAVRIGGRVANMVAEAWQEDRDAPIAAVRMTLMLDRGPRELT